VLVAQRAAQKNAVSFFVSAVYCGIEFSQCVVMYFHRRFIFYFLVFEIYRNLVALDPFPVKDSSSTTLILLTLRTKFGHHLQG